MPSIKSLLTYIFKKNRVFGNPENSWCYCDALLDLVPFVQLKNVKNTHGGVLLFAEACNFTKINTPSWVFFSFLKLYKWYQITQRIIFIMKIDMFKVGITPVAKGQMKNGIQ